MVAIEQQIITKLASLLVPYTQQTFVEAKIVPRIMEQKSHYELVIPMPFPMAGMVPQLKQEVEQALLHLSLEKPLTLQFEWQVRSHGKQSAGTKPIHQVKNIIAIASGKGGVGKSTSAVNLALALQAEGARVGLLDADIYGPSQPRMLGINELVDTSQGLLPVLAHGLETMSIGYLVAEEQAVVWRGPMVSSALQQLLYETQWSNLDYLFIDLPPGTGDVQLTLAQKVPVSGAVIVTTPQDIALADAKKGIAMFRKVAVPILGVIENMSYYHCPKCGHNDPIFDQDGGEKIAEKYAVPLLGKIPLNARIRKETDSGTPTVVAEPAGELSEIYRHIARYLAAELSLTRRNFGNQFPKIVIENK